MGQGIGKGAERGWKRKEEKVRETSGDTGQGSSQNPRMGVLLSFEGATQGQFTHHLATVAIGTERPNQCRSIAEDANRSLRVHGWVPPLYILPDVCEKDKERTQGTGRTEMEEEEDAGGPMVSLRDG